jgi:hypothetical protein
MHREPCLSCFDTLGSQTPVMSVLLEIHVNKLESSIQGSTTYKDENVVQTL